MHKNQTSLIVAKIKVKNIDGMLDVQSFAENNDNIYKENFEFRFLLLRKDAEGKYSQKIESGNFSLSPNQLKNLFSLKIVLHKKEELKAYIFIRKENKLISKDSAVIKSEIRPKNDYIAEESIEIQGLVVEDVITKLGKDFYDFFYQRFSSSTIKYPFIVNIIEKPAIGINSQITIEIEGKTVFRMLTQPNEEFLQNSAKRAILVINDYYRNKRLLFKRNIQY